MDKKKEKISLCIAGEDRPVEIPAEGSLGLLALGAVGIIAWRKVRDAKNNDS